MNTKIYKHLIKLSILLEERKTLEDNQKKLGDLIKEERKILLREDLSCGLFKAVDECNNTFNSERSLFYIKNNYLTNKGKDKEQVSE